MRHDGEARFASYPDGIQFLNGGPGVKTLLITGASGFTAQHLIPVATKAGWRCVGLNADLTDAASVTEEIARAAPDAVVHRAAVSYVAHADAAQIYAVNVVGTLNLLDALSQLSKKPSVVCLPSSSTVYLISYVPQIARCHPEHREGSVCPPIRSPRAFAQTTGCFAWLNMTAWAKGLRSEARN